MTLDRIINVNGIPMRESDLDRTPPYRVTSDTILAYHVLFTTLDGRKSLTKQEVTNLIPFLTGRSLLSWWKTTPEFNLRGCHYYGMSGGRIACPEIEETFFWWTSIEHCLVDYIPETYLITKKGVHDSVDKVLQYQERSPPAAVALSKAIQQYRKQELR